MSSLSEAEKARIRQDVLAEHGLSKKPRRFSDLIRIGGKPRESYRQYKARLAKLKAEGNLTLKDLIRIR